MKLEELIEKYKNNVTNKKPLVNIIRSMKREGIENFYICRKDDVDFLIENLEHLQKENEELKEHNRKYLEAEIFSANQIKNFEKQVKQH